MQRVLCLRHESSDTLGLAPGALRSAGTEPVCVDIWRADRWPDVSAFDAFVVFGGSVSSLDDDAHPYFDRELGMLREALDLGIPTLGVCLGAQLLAQACGAPVTRAAEPEVGFKPLTLTRAGEDDPIVATFRGGALAFEWHEDVFELPDGATLLATGEAGVVQAYRIGSAVGVQFHPEVTQDELESWIVASGPDLPAVWGRDPGGFRDEIEREITGHNERGTAFFQSFVRTALSMGAQRSA